MCSSKKHDKSLTYTGSGLRVAYADHDFFTFVNIDEKGMSERPFRLRGLRRMTQKKSAILKTTYPPAPTIYICV